MCCIKASCIYSGASKVNAIVREWRQHSHRSFEYARRKTYMDICYVCAKRKINGYTYILSSYLVKKNQPISFIKTPAQHFFLQTYSNISIFSNHKKQKFLLNSQYNNANVTF